MSAFLRDLRIAVRQLLRAPGFTLASVVTLGLGIGAVTTLFGLVRAILLVPLPYPEPDRLVVLASADPPRDVRDVPVSLPDVRDWSGRSRTMQAIGVFSTLPSRLVLQTESGARELRTTHVSSGFFTALGVAPVAGRVIRPEDETGDPRVVVVSHGFWMDQLGGDAGAVDRSLRLSDQEFRVIGVMPDGFGFPEPGMDVWTPLAIVPASSIPMEVRGVRFLDAIGRMAPGISPEQARDELGSIASALAAEYADSNDELRGVDVVPLRDHVVGGVERALILALAAVGFVLIVACVNVASLVLARGLGRSREFAVRLSLGAGRRHLIRMLVTDSLVLAALGGTVGALLASVATRGIRLWNAGILPRVEELALGPNVLLFATVVALTAALVAGLVPALASVRLDPAEELRRGGRSASAPALMARRWLMSTQFAASLVLLVGAGLLGRSLLHLQTLNVGYEPEGALAVALVIPANRYPAQGDYMAFHREALDRFRAIPGVEAAGSIRYLPTRGTGESTDWTVPGEESSVGAGRPAADLLQITPGLLSAMGIRLLQGRDLSAQDRQSPDAPVLLVNETLARIAFPEGNAVGRTIELGDAENTWTIVGVTGDVLQRGPQFPPVPAFYVSNEQIPRRAMTFVLRTPGDPLSLAGPVLAQLRAMDPGQAVSEIQTLEATLESAVSRPRFFTIVLASLAFLTVTLTAMGLYGVLAFLVRLRTPEIGIRLALGATGRQVVRLVLDEGAAPLAAGTVLGIAVAIASAGLMRTLLHGVEPLDPWTFLGSIALLLLIAATATWIPARRAAALDPLIAIRPE